MAENNQNVEENILNRINIFDTVFHFAETYDLEIKNIKVYGVFDENNKCKNPLFHGSDVIKYLRCNNNNAYRDFKKFKPIKEIVKKFISIQCGNHTRPVECNLLTKYGLIRAVNLCGEAKTGITFREFIYALFDSFDNSNQSEKNPILNNLDIAINTDEIKQEIADLEKPKKGIVYFIRDTGTNYIKIGRTDGDPEDRLSCLQVGNPSELIIVKLIECDDSIALERELHKKYAAFHIRGEWFNFE
jgi:hypothetical protein